MISNWNAIRCGMVEASREFFDEMEERDEITWRVL